MKKRQIEAVILDMDGVLWLSGAIHTQAYREVLEPVGIAFDSYEEFAGRRTDEAITLMLHRGGIEAAPELVRRLTEAKQRIAWSHLGERPPIVPHCVELLHDLKKRFRLALASSASPGNVDLFLRASTTAGMFDAVVTGNDVTEAKPAPAIYQLALSRLSVSAEQALVVEDAVAGVLAARTAGISVLAVLGTARTDDLLTAGAIAVHRSLAETVEDVLTNY